VTPAAAIGVFDSGVGGLTVLRALRDTLPGEDFIYLGDTARLPYGTKTRATVTRYALQSAAVLTARGIKALVVACNTASAAALPALRERCGSLPVIGVIEPGALAACLASAAGRIAVLATEGTIRGGVYEQTIRRQRPDATVTGLACQVFVALAEEGWVEGEAVTAVAERYLRPLLQHARPDTLVLGCTHFPVLRPVIAAVAGAEVTLIDSAATTATAVAALLGDRHLRQAEGREGRTRFLATDGVQRFATVGSRFLGSAIDADEVELVDL
jgi:glutamate racemase